ncbi:ABC transporter ATP-binding protein [Maioricimonas rarisocia]|nr:ATP-binding cassette domain-containing protein [Maioricimonas rarisocia]
MSDVPAILVDALNHHYGERQALCDVSFTVATGGIFGLLGPNGGGKTTLFRILGTLLPLQSGRAAVCGHDVASEPAAVRRQLGVTFQSPSLDGKLTVAENLKYQGYLYGLSGASLRSRMDQMLARVGLSDRSRDIVDTLSGGLKRRVEIAKSLLHGPRVLLLDEPSTGLDPGARHDLWRTLQRLRDDGVTVLVTTHLMEEAQRCDRLGILSQGSLVALGEPEELQASVGGDCLTIQSNAPDPLAESIRQQFGLDVQKLGEALRIESGNGHELVRDLVAAFPDQIRAIALGKPTLEDVFIQRTGHRFWEEDQAEPQTASAH